MRLTWTRCVVLLAILSTTAQAKDFHVSLKGSDTNEGTEASPFRTVQHAADVMNAGDTCYVHAGTYRETVVLKTSGEADKPIRFMARPGEKVVLQGTDPIEGQWKIYKGNIYQTQVDKEFIQLFVDGQMMVEARWPNMRFPDELWDRSKWSPTGKGSFHGKIVDPQLAQTGIDWTGARAVLNVGHQFYTWTRIVNKHAAGSDTFEYTADLLPESRYAHKTAEWWEKDHYYLVGKLEALDYPGEWFLDPQSQTLYLWPLNNKNPSSCRIEAKTRNYAFKAKDIDYIELVGFHFWGTTFVFENCNHCVVENCHLSYPTYVQYINHRGPKGPWAVATLMQGSHNVIRRCSLAYSAATGFAMYGTDNIAEDNLIHDVCWYGTLRHVPLELRKDDVASGGNTIARNNTIYNFGNAGIFFLHQPYIIEYNHVYNGGLIGEDIALIYTANPTCAGSIVRYNWAHGCRTEKGKGLGIRGDSKTYHLTVHHNVVWDCGRDGIISKGDYNKVYNNTILDIGNKNKPGNYVSLHTKAEPSRPWIKNQKLPLLSQQNASSEIVNNVARTLTRDPWGKPITGIQLVSHNYLAKDPELVNPLKRDFRPQKGSPLIDAGREIPGVTDGFKGKAPDIGAYEFGGANWKPGITWMPQEDE